MQVKRSMKFGRMSCQSWLPNERRHLERTSLQKSFFLASRHRVKASKVQTAFIARVFAEMYESLPSSLVNEENKMSTALIEYSLTH